MGYIDTAEKEAMEAMQKYPDKFFELKSGDIPPELLASLIEKITVVSQEQIEITYAYSDIIEKWCEEAQLLDKKGLGKMNDGYVATYLRLSDDDEDLGERKGKVTVF